MNQINIRTTCRKLLADIFTPVGIYLRLRDRFRDTVLLESTDHHAAENSWSFIGINAIGGIEIKTSGTVEWKLPGQLPVSADISDANTVPRLLFDYLKHFTYDREVEEARFAQGLYGYTAYDAAPFFEPGHGLSGSAASATYPLPLIRYRLYQYVIALNHHKDELFILENHVAGVPSDIQVVEQLIRNRDVPEFPFALTGEESSNMTDDEYRTMVQKGIAHCHRGDVFQIVLSRRFSQPFSGDEFNVYRSLRSINPSPYLFFFDYGDYRLMGSSPEAQVIIEGGNAVVHPIAGTFRRTGNEEVDRREAERLRQDLKENAEHVMLVDLARNDLSRCCDQVSVTHYREVQYYSHVIHLVSEVVGNVRPGTHPFELLAHTFPAGTLSGAPKIKAMELISRYEPTARGYYGGAIGFVGFDGSCNHAIMIRTFLSRDNTLYYQAGAGVVAASSPESELQEVNNKLGALKKSIQFATRLP